MTSLASPLLTGDALNIGFVALLVLDLAVAVALGAAAAGVLHLLMSVRMPAAVKAILVLAFGFAIYELADLITNWSKSTLPFEVHMEPLLIGLIGGFGVANFSPHRLEFEELLHAVGPPVYVAFFTITGLSLKLDVLWTVLPVALALFVLRALGIGVGSWLGARWVGEPSRHRSLYSLTFVTQAGIALGLAREVAVQFPTLGDTFATLIISVIVINEVVGPLFLKAGLRRSGESHEPGARSDTADAAVVFGVEPQSLALARGLQRVGWDVVVADTNAEQVERLAVADIDERWISAVDDESLAALIDDKTVAVVAMLADDSDNAAVLRFAADQGVPRLIVRPANGTGHAAVAEGETVVIDPGTAMVALLEQAVSAPQSTALLMRQDPSRLVNQVTISNPDVHGRSVRDLRLPPDVLLLQIDRDGTGLAVSGHTSLRIGDEVTVLSPADSLEEVRVQLAG
jgi:Trk K+ transport system NAD-binding subunit